MSCDHISIPLTDEQKSHVCGVLSTGCDRQTAVNLVGCSLADLQRAMLADAQFAAGVRRAEASVELAHMRTVQQAAKESKNWRASVWWLERLAPERFGPRPAGAITERQLKAFIGLISDVLRDEVTCPALRRKIAARLQHLADSLGQMLRDGKLAPTGAGSHETPLALAADERISAASAKSPGDEGN